MTERAVPRFVMVALLCALAMPSIATASVGAAPFRIQEGATKLGDLRPLALEIDRTAPPDVSLEEAGRKYVDVFRDVSDARTRVSLLDRIHHLQTRFGGDLGISEDEETRLYREALPDFDQLIADDTYHGPRDQLLYQAARAASHAEEAERSVGYLERLVAEHEDTDLAPEAHFRIGEHYFSEEAYARAESAYQQVIAKGGGTHFEDKAIYMSGWSQFLLDRHEEAGDTFVTLLDRHHDPETGFGQLAMSAREQVDDTMRVLSIMSAYEGGARALDDLLARHDGRDYAFLLYERLASFYRNQARFRDSVAAAQAFRQRHPDHSHAPILADEAIRSLNAGQYHEDARGMKADFVMNYGAGEWLQRLDQDRRIRLLESLDDLGRWHYRQGQAAEEAEARRTEFARAADFLERWTELVERPAFATLETDQEEDRGGVLTLAADAAQQAGQMDRAADLYAEAAYDSPEFTDVAEAGYALVQVRRDQWQSLQGEEALDQLVASSRRFIETFPASVHRPGVRQDLANTLYNEDRLAEADAVAQNLVANEQAPAERRRAGWLVIGHVALEQQALDSAEGAYREALALMGADDPRRDGLRERLAGTIYRQAERAVDQGDTDQAVHHFARVEAEVPGRELAVKAHFDRASTLMEARQWSRGIEALNAFRQAHGGHELAARVPEMLVFAYRESGDQAAAADELLAHEPNDMTAEELWQRRLRAANHYREAGQVNDAISLYADYIANGTHHFGDHEFQQERRADIANLYSERGNESAALQWHERLLDAEQGASGTSRSQYLASRSAMRLGREAAEDFAAIRLTAPLSDSIGRKREAMSVAVDYFQQARASGFSEMVTESTWRLGELYRQLAEDVLESERPDGLTELQADQYELLLEEEAYPFEERAIAQHQRNQERIPEGNWSSWVARSLEALAELYPARYKRDTLWMEVRHD